MAEQNLLEQNPRNYEVCESSVYYQTWEKASSELGEHPETREELIQELREKVTQWKPQTNEEKSVVLTNTEDKFLVTFLRARKFDTSKALQLYVNYHKFRLKYSPLLSNTKFKSVKQVFESGIIKVLNSRALDGSKVLCVYPGNWNTSKVSFLDNFRATFMVLDKLIQDEMTQVHGFSILYDFTNSSFMSMFHAAQSEQIKNGVLIDLLQDAFPARFKAIHLLRHPLYIGIVLGVIKPFMKQKLRDRIHIHGEDYVSLHSFIDPLSLPKDLGGMVENSTFMDVISTLPVQQY